MKNKYLLLLFLAYLPMNLSAVASQKMPCPIAAISIQHKEINQNKRVKSSRLQRWLKKVHSKKTKNNKKRKANSADAVYQILIGLGIISLLVLIIVGSGAGISILGLSGFIVFTLATGLGFVLSKKDTQNEVPTILFVLAIIANILGASFILYFKGLF